MSTADPDRVEPRGHSLAPDPARNIGVAPAAGPMLAFVRRQQRDWMVTVARTSLDRLAYQMVFPYLSIYIIALGATATQLGLVNSLGMLAAGLVGPFTGWLIDRHGPRSFYLAGIALLAVAYLTYAVAQSWGVTILAMTTYWLGSSISGHSCATICGNCLANQDRATGMTICETVAAGLLGIVGPVLGTAIVVSSGQVDAAGIRPLFVVAFAITVGTFVFILTQLSGQRWGVRGPGRGIVLDLADVLKSGRYLKRWLAIAAIGQLPAGMVFAFSSVYAHEVKGADAMVLGGMATAAAIGSIALAVPLGRIADRIGRKRVLYATIPLFALSCLVLVWAPGPVALIAAGALQSFYYIGGPIAAAMERELVPASYMGRWIGIARVVKMLVSAILVLVAGAIWDGLGPQFVFLAFVAIDLGLRLPLLVTMPETLGIRFAAQSPPVAR